MLHVKRMHPLTHGTKVRTLGLIQQRIKSLKMQLQVLDQEARQVGKLIAPEVIVGASGNE